MKHPRTLIREAVAARLIESLPKVDARITPARISIHRSTPLFAGKLPAIMIYTRDERIEDQPNADPGLRYRKLDLSVEIITIFSTLYSKHFRATLRVPMTLTSTASQGFSSIRGTCL